MTAGLKALEACGCSERHRANGRGAVPYQRGGRAEEDNKMHRREETEEPKNRRTDEPKS